MSQVDHKRLVLELSHQLLLVDIQLVDLIISYIHFMTVEKLLISV